MTNGCNATLVPAREVKSNLQASNIKSVSVARTDFLLAGEREQSGMRSSYCSLDTITSDAKVIPRSFFLAREDNHKRIRKLIETFELPNNAISHDCMYHIVWCTKYRRPVLVDEVSHRFKALISEYAKELEVEILEIEIKSSYLTLLVTCDPKLGIHRAIKRLKASTSRALREEFDELKTRLPSLWTNSYHLTTVGTISDDDIRSYIREQKNV